MDELKRWSDHRSYIDPEGPNDPDTSAFVQTARKNAGFFKYPMMWVNELPVVITLMSIMLLSIELKQCFSSYGNYEKGKNIPFNPKNQNILF